MSATEQMRAVLDGLMGTARDGSDAKRQHLNFTDQRVCRAFLLDCCPHDIFASTKLELGECSKVHDPALRADYIQANKEQDLMYEVSALERLQSFVSDADKKTDYLKKKLAETQEELTAEETSKLNRVHDLTETLGKKLAQLDKIETDGDEESRKKLLDESEKIKKERAQAEAEYRRVSRPASSHQQQNLRVCDVCSAYLGINDNDSRLADHFGGKLHLGFITVREKLEELKKMVAEKRRSTKVRSSHMQSDRHSNRARNTDMDREREYDHDRNSRKYDGSRSRDYDRYRDRDHDRDRYRDRDVSDRSRDSRCRDRDRERDRSRSSSRYYRDVGRDSRPRDRDRDRYRDERADHTDRSRDHGDRFDRADARDRVDRSERHSSTSSNRGFLGAFDPLGGRLNDRELTYQRRLREWEKREAEKAKKYAIRNSEEQDRKQLEEQESRKLKEFLEDYKDDRDDIRFYRGSALSRRLAERRVEIEQDEFERRKEKMELEMLSRSCAVGDVAPQIIECADETKGVINEQVTGYSKPTSPTVDKKVSKINGSVGGVNNDEGASLSQFKNEPIYTNLNPSSTSASRPSQVAQNKGANSEEKRKQVEDLIGRIPTDKDQLFARELDWSLLDESLMERRIRPWVTKKISEYMGEKEVDLIDFVCSLLNAHTDGNKMLSECAVVLDDEAEKFVVHMWRLLIFELEAKKIGLRK